MTISRYNGGWGRRGEVRSDQADSTREQLLHHPGLERARFLELCSCAAISAFMSFNTVKSHVARQLMKRACNRGAGV